MSLSFAVFRDSTLAVLLADFTQRIRPERGGRGIQFGTNEHGFSTLDAPFIPLSLADSFTVYDWPGTPHAIISDEATGGVWEGRIETIAILPGGVRLGGLGYWRALRDVPFTDAWSVTSVKEWREMTLADRAKSAPAKYNSDNNNRLYLALKKNEIYANNDEKGRWVYIMPDGGETDLATISFDYDVFLPTNWKVETNSWLSDFSTGTLEDTITGTGAQITGSKSITLTANRQAINIEAYNVTGSAYTCTAESDAWYVKITNIRIKTTTAAAVYASAIAERIVSFVSGINSLQLSDSVALISATTTDLKDETYRDAYPADVLDRLARLHNYEVGVWADRVLHFRALGDKGRAFYVDVTRLIQLERDLDKIHNSVYAVYRDANGAEIRTAESSSAESQSRLSLVRRGFVNVRSTSSTEAGAHRDAYLSDRQDFAVRASIEFDRLRDIYGAEYPLYVLRSGDTLTMRNLPATAGSAVDNIRTFRIGSTLYNSERGDLKATPREPVPTLVTLISRRAVGEGAGFKLP